MFSTIFGPSLLQKEMLPCLYALRTEVRVDFNIHGTKKFYDAVLHQKSKKYDVLSLLYFGWPKKPVPYMK